MLRYAALCCATLRYVQATSHTALLTAHVRGDVYTDKYERFIANLNNHFISCNEHVGVIHAVHWDKPGRTDNGCRCVAAVFPERARAPQARATPNVGWNMNRRR